MKNNRLFNDFLKNTVNLNQSRLDRLDASSGAVETFLRGSSWEPNITLWYPQGSWAHKTITKPVSGAPFDADVIAFVQPVSGWEPRDYIDKLFETFRLSDLYKDKVKRWSHCVTINYAGERKMDVAPCVVTNIEVNGSNLHQFHVCNRDANHFETSSPIDYTNWLTQKNAVCGSNSFRKVTRLLKYLRDIKKTFSCSSVCLTTLLAGLVSDFDKDHEDFSDTPTALRTMMQRLDGYLSQHYFKPRVPNPFTDEDFSDCWTEAQYHNFKNFVNKYRIWIEDAYSEKDRNKGIKKWRKVFGSEFGKGENLDQARSFGKRVASIFAPRQPDLAKLVASDSYDIIDFASVVEIDNLPSDFLNLSYVEDPIWANSTGRGLETFITATVHRQRGEGDGATVSSGRIVKKGQEMKFRLNLKTGTFFDWKDYQIFWRVTNTGDEAANAEQLRGDIIREYRSADRWESLSYRGLHFVEAFVVRERDSALVSRSAPFLVAIK
ncbi:hypothetical protein SAMN04488004_11677 [Loktanella salsilacus]|uniref:Adenylyl/Guanylyl and SMODS C-terminal sensor domain-containing protein n=1 Tax=Loktanella salsilacus TaxID=195913 RepID=A0A1I4H8P9_9RHOB|nr:nucleotidyltransferase [Loktanella salsilacus]SFL38682.1 hypothetical protein SAMN04488004_11677 [Loktanella salsilacus]